MTHVPTPRPPGSTRPPGAAGRPRNPTRAPLPAGDSREGGSGHPCWVPIYRAGTTFSGAEDPYAGPGKVTPTL
ncbi:hypothetical protein Pflav_090280 [Phytohabitans flavus]|uniref:Uncharacterized protein n=1 Tax=Phytohabitans flavus TaxID=1076124 RepID=A0A6F8Y9F8_9ACTN|nr:hypothetical protein Pflav_090280 [Phytohabitans flavus]